MLSTLPQVASLLSSYGLLLLANGLFGTLLGVRTKIEGFPTEIVGFIMAAYFAGLLSGGVMGVRVVAAIGHIRAFAAFASAMSASVLVHVLLIDPWLWALLRFVAGFCMAGMVMVTESWLNERATNETRGQVLSFYMITNYFAAGCGQLLLPLGDPAEFHLFTVASIIFSVALVPVLVTRATAPMPSSPQRMRLGDLYRISPLGVVGVFCSGLVNSAFFGMGPVFAKGIGLDVVHISFFMASATFAGLLLQWPLGRFSDRIDRRWVLSAAGVATAAGCAGIGFFSGQATLPLYAAAAVYGAFAFTIYSLSAAHTNDFAPRDRLVQVASGLLIVYGVGATLGPMLAALIMGQLGPRGLFVWSGLVALTLGVYALYRMRQRAAREKRSPFVAVPASQFTSEELYASIRNQMDRDLAHLSGGLRRRQGERERDEY